MTEREYVLPTEHRSMPSSESHAAPVTPGFEIAAEAVRKDKGEVAPVPDIPVTNPNPPLLFKSAADIVRALRSLGLPKAAAKAVAAGGWPALQALGGDQTETETDRGDLLASIKAAAARMKGKDDA